MLLGHHPNSSVLASPKDIAVMVAISAIKLTVAQLTQVALCTFFARKEIFLPCHSQSLLACDQHVLLKRKIVMSLLRLRSTLYPNDKVYLYQGECLSFRERLFVNPSDIKL